MTARAMMITDAAAWVGARQLFGPLSMTVPAATVTTVMGPSGVGKSTLLAFIAGTLGSGVRATGRVVLDGRDITPLRPERRNVGLLFQDAVLFPHLSVGQNVAFGLRPGIKGAARRQAIDAALEEVGLSGFASRDPAQLSGGERARVALMRSLLAEPEALLLDEPFSKLDASLRAQVRRMVFDIIVRRRVPTLLVTHDETDAAAAGGPVIALERPES